MDGGTAHGAHPRAGRGTPRTRCAARGPVRGLGDARRRVGRPWHGTDFLPSGLYRRPRHLTGSCLAARGLGLRHTADREFHPALKVCVYAVVVQVYARMLGSVKVSVRRSGGHRAQVCGDWSRHATRPAANEVQGMNRVRAGRTPLGRNPNVRGVGEEVAHNFFCRPPCP
jgi:hypothetical protein